MCLGAPGSGKTTYLLYVAIQSNQGELLPDRVPVFIRLIEFAERLAEQPELSLLNYIEQLFCAENVEHPKAAEILLQEGRVLVLLDGLDEVPKADSKSVLTRIREFCRTYHKNTLIVTCRTNALDYSFGNLGFTEVIVADFNQKQIEIFAHKWFMAFARNDTEAGKARAKQFIEKLQQPENKRIRDLAVTPILLNLTCLVFQDIGNFPSNRAKLYQQGLNTLLKEWDSSKGVQREELYGNLSVKDRERLLTHVAFTTFTQNRYFFEQTEIEEYINGYLRTLNANQEDISQQDSEAVLRSIEVQHGLLVERAREIYSFSHLTFQEYFTAKDFVNSSGQQNWINLATYVNQKRWRQVFLLASGMMPSADALLLAMKREIQKILASDKVLQQFTEWLQQKYSSINVPCKPAAIRFFCFSLGFNVDLHLDLDPSHPIYFDPAPYPDLAADLDLAYALEVALKNSRTHDQSDMSNVDLDTARKYMLNLNPELGEVLQQLKNQLPDQKGDQEIYKQWWQINGKAWIEQLRNVIIKYRYIGHDWQFSNKHKDRVQEYYDANKLLVDCLNSSFVLSDEVRQEIEENLLFPTAEIGN
nr:NACHT domain-containing NTPase [Planktothrix sp. FACHB-1355]